jgi:hypothetical protein
MTLTAKSRSTRRKTCHSAILCHHSIRHELTSNPSLRDDRSAKNSACAPGTFYAPTRKTKSVLMLKAIMPACSDQHKKHTNTIWIYLNEEAGVRIHVLRTVHPSTLHWTLHFRHNFMKQKKKGFRLCNSAWVNGSRKWPVKGRRNCHCDGP